MRRKHAELSNTLDRLEGGLTKLINTGSQVDDLKAKLAAQEVELKQKNEDADKLIQKVSNMAVHIWTHTHARTHTCTRTHKLI